MLKRSLLVGLIICSTFLFLACSFQTDFVVVNNSGDFIEVIYEAKNNQNKSITPYIINAEDFNKNRREWRKVPETQFTINDEKSVVKVRLAPNEVLRFESVDASRIQTDPYKELNTKRIELLGKNGSMIFEGNQVFDQSKPETSKWVLFGPSTGTYAIYYK